RGQARPRTGAPPTKFSGEPGRGPRVMETDLELRIGLFIWPLPTPVRTGSGSKGSAPLRSQPQEHPWEGGNLFFPGRPRNRAAKRLQTLDFRFQPVTADH